MHNTIKETVEIGVVAAPASYAAGVYPSIGDFPLFLVAEHIVTPDFILRCIAGIATILIVWVTIHKHIKPK